MLERLTSRQVAEWHEYYNIEPWGWRQDWLRAGLVTATIANVHRKKGKPAIKPEDCIPKEIEAPKPVRKQTQDEMIAARDSLLARFKKMGRLVIGKRDG